LNLSESAEQPPASGPPSTHENGVDPAPVGEDGEQPVRKRKRRRFRVLLIVLLAAAVIAAVVYLVRRHEDSAAPAAPASELRSATALATSINVRPSDLPAGWAQTTASPIAPPPALASERLKAVTTFATCVQQPASVVEGWLGVAPFPGQIASVTSPTFQSGSAPTVQILSTTKVIGTPAETQSLSALFTAPNFGTCYGQYQAATVTSPATAQVQAVPLTTPTGAKAYGYVTTFTLSNQSPVSVGQAFIVGGHTTTVVQPSAGGVTIPPAGFLAAYQAVVERVARSAG